MEPSEKTDGESGSVSGAETITASAGIEVVTPRDPSNQNQPDEGFSSSGKKKKPAVVSMAGTGGSPVAYALS